MLDIYPIGTHLTLANGHVCPAYGHRSRDYRLSPLCAWEAVEVAHTARERVTTMLYMATPPGGTGVGVEIEANQLACVAVITLGLAQLAKGEAPTTADAWRIVGNAGLAGIQILRETTRCAIAPDCPGEPIGLLRGSDGSRRVCCEAHTGTSWVTYF